MQNRSDRPGLSMAGKVCLITGGSSGIGQTTAVELARISATVVVLCRDASAGQRVLAELVAAGPSARHELLLADLSDLSSVRNAAIEFGKKFDSLDVLINNAAVFTSRRQTTKDGFELQFGVNYLSHFYLTNLLLPKLSVSPAARVINTGSVSHYFGKIRFDDLQLNHSYDGLKAYNQSKLAMVLFTTALTQKLKGTRITVNTSDPGRVNTNIGTKHASGLYKHLWNLNRPLLRKQAKGALSNLFLAASPDVAQRTGGYYYGRRAIWSLPRSRNMALAEQLWQISLSLTGLNSISHEPVH